MGAGGGALATAANAGYKGHFDLTHPTQAKIDAATVLVTAAEPGLSGVNQGLARAGVVAFETEFGRLPTVAEIQTGKTQDALRASAGPLGAVAHGTGAITAGAFGTGLDLHGQTTSALTDAKGAYDPQNTIDTANSARAGGRTIGYQFDLGMRDGINNGKIEVVSASSVMASAAAQAARDALKQKSPSLVGVDIGQQFVAGIAQGLEQVAPITEATGLLVSSLTDAFARVPPVVVPVALASPLAITPAGSIATSANAGASLTFGPLTFDLTIEMADGSTERGTAHIPPYVVSTPPGAPLERRVEAELQAIGT